MSTETGDDNSMFITIHLCFFIRDIARWFGIPKNKPSGFGAMVPALPYCHIILGSPYCIESIQGSLSRVFHVGWMVLLLPHLNNQCAAAVAGWRDRVHFECRAAAGSKEAPAALKCCCRYGWQAMGFRGFGVPTFEISPTTLNLAAPLTEDVGCTIQESIHQVCIDANELGVLRGSMLKATKLPDSGAPGGFRPENHRWNVSIDWLKGKSTVESRAFTFKYRVFL